MSAIHIFPFPLRWNAAENMFSPQVCALILHLSVNVVSAFFKKPQHICILSIRNWWRCSCLSTVELSVLHGCRVVLFWQHQLPEKINWNELQMTIPTNEIRTLREWAQNHNVRWIQWMPWKNRQMTKTFYGITTFGILCRAFIIVFHLYERTRAMATAATMREQYNECTHSLLNLK